MKLFAVFLLLTCTLITNTQASFQIYVNYIKRLDVAHAIQVEWSADQSKLAVLTGEQIFVWDTNNWELLYTISDAFANDIAWHPTEDLIAGLNCCLDERISIWKSETGELDKQLIRHLPDVGIMILHAIAWNPSGDYIVSDSFIDTLTLWDLKSETPHTFAPLNKPDLYSIVNLVWSNSGKYILSGGIDGNIRVWDARSGEIILAVEGYKHIAWHPDETLFAGAGFENKVKVWKRENGQVEAEFVGHQNTITSIDWNSINNMLSSTDADGTLLIWNYPTGDKLPFGIFDNAFITNATWSPDGGQLAVTSRDSITILNIIQE